MGRETITSSGEKNVARVFVSVEDTPIGLSILEHEQYVYDELADSEFSEEFEAEESITIAAADGEAVEVGVDGENLEPLGASGEGVTRTFTDEP